MSASRRPLRLLTALVLLAALVVAVPSGPALAWEKDVQRSLIDDSKTIILRRSSENEYLSASGVNLMRAQLILRCKENTTAAYVHFGFPIADIGSTREGARITTRIDLDKATSHRWSVSTGRSAAGLWSGAQSIPFIRSLLDRVSLVVRVEPPRRPPQDVLFIIDGLREHAADLAAACNWSLDAASAATRPAPPAPKPPEKKTATRPAPAAPPPDAATLLSTAELAELRAHVKQCWNVPAAAESAKDFAVDIALVMNRDGTVREARLTNTARMGTDPLYRATAESALRATLNPRCSPLKLPAGRYDDWKVMKLTLDPRVVRPR